MDHKLVSEFEEARKRATIDGTSEIFSEKHASETTNFVSRKLRAKYWEMDVDEFTDCVDNGVLKAMSKYSPHRRGRNGLRSLAVVVAERFILNRLQHFKTKKAKRVKCISELSREMRHWSTTETEAQVFRIADVAHNKLVHDTKVALNELDELEQSVLMLRYVDELKVEVIIEKLNLTNTEEFEELLGLAEERFKAVYLNRACML